MSPKLEDFLNVSLNVDLSYLPKSTEFFHRF